MSSNDNNNNGGGNGGGGTSRVRTGRKKIPIEKMESKSHLQVTFSKRRSGLFKKANELSILCGAKVAVVVFSPGGKVYAYGHPNLNKVLDKYCGETGTPPALPAPPTPQRNIIEEIMRARQEANVRALAAQLDAMEAKILELTKANQTLSLAERGRPSISDLPLSELLPMKRSMEMLRSQVQERLTNSMMSFHVQSGLLGPYSYFTGNGDVGPNGGVGPNGVGQSAMGHSGVGPSIMGPSVVGSSVMGYSSMGQSVMGYSGMGQSVMGHSVVGQSVMEHNGVGLSVMGPNGMGPSGVGHSGVGPSGMELSGMGQNGVGLSGMGQNCLSLSGMGPNGVGLSGVESSGEGRNGMGPSVMGPINGMLGPSFMVSYSVEMNRVGPNDMGSSGVGPSF